MPIPTLRRLAMLLGALPLLVGCSKDLDEVFNPNLPPEIRLTSAPVSTTTPEFYARRMNWVGYDPDGRIEYFLFAIDPSRPDLVDSAWQRTSKNEEILFFSASQTDTTNLARATEFHTFAIAAVDNQGAVSKPVWRTFNSFTLAPFVFVESPIPNDVFTPIVTPTLRIRWRGIDPDGQFTTKPVKYKYKLFRPRDPDFPGVPDPIGTILSNPKILNIKYAPNFGPTPNCPACSYWDSSGAETTEVQFTNLIPNNIYMFAVTGYDEAGAYDPVFSPKSNLLKFAVTYAGTLGPQICMFNEFFFFCYSSGGYANDPTRYFNVEVPAGQSVTFNWFGIPPEGADIRHYRWVMDLQDLSDEAQRTDENSDWYHWSSYSLQTTSATVGPFPGGEEHLFYIECEDNNGLRSLGIIRFAVVQATFENEILFVDDTRLTPDQRSPGGGYDPPRGVWPSSAELDTFFFARGQKQWKGYPPGVLSPRGIFDGYAWDSVGTRGTILSGLVPLSTLGKYKLVVWYVDDVSATYQNTPLDILSPITSLRLMSTAGQPSTISTYLKQGGKAWVFGGGAAYATLAFWQRRNTPVDEFTNADLELVPGRFMYDFAKWQSALTTFPSAFALLNDQSLLSLLAGIPENPANSPANLARPGRNWTEHGLDHNLSMPDYSKLTSFTTGAPLLGPRDCVADPPPPGRVCNSFYIVSTFTAEFMGTKVTATPNFIREDADPNPDLVREESTLDTLYLNFGGTARQFRPIMTYYHGFQTPQVVFSGFPLWYFSRPQVQVVADFVLQDIFGFQRNGTPAPARPAGATRTAPTPNRAPALGRTAATATR